MLKRVDITYSENRGYHVDLPTYFMVAGTFLPIEKGLIHADGAYPNADPADVMQLKPTVIVSLPEDECRSDDGQLCKIKMAAKYRNHPIFDTADYRPPTLRDFHPIELDPPKDDSIFHRVQRAMGFHR